MIEVWRGGVNAWECDDNGHLNTRFFVQRAAEGVAMLCALSGLPGLHRPGSPTTAVIREMHIRFHREALMSSSLRILAGFAGVGPSGAETVLVMEDALGGALKATFRIGLAHADSADPAALRPWPAGFAPPRATAPAEALPRSTRTGPVRSAASGARAAELGLMRIGMGVVGPDALDPFGRLAPQGFIGAVSDGIRALTAPLREVVLRHADPVPDRMGGAVVEVRALHLDWPRAGDAYEVRSGLAAVEGQVKSLVHWMLCPVTGRAWGAMQAIAVDFDLDRRALVRLTPEARAGLQALCVPGLTL